VDLEQPLPDALVGKAGFSLELLPSAFWGKSFHLGQAQGIFPRQANGPMIPTPEGALKPAPLGSGSRFSAAPEDPLRWLVIERLDGGEMALYDGRNTAQDNWFVLQAELLPGKTRNALELVLWANAQPGWKRLPVVLVSQVGYHPDQEKRALIELDIADQVNGEAVLLRIDGQSGHSPILSARPALWGPFLRYNYAEFDFSAIRQPGVYQVRYGEQISAPFQISSTIYQKDVWQPTLETFLPVQMCHMTVHDRYQVWHGACHLDDAVQAPLNHQHFDGYIQGEASETPFQPFEHIPGLDRGGWHDAGDYDLAAGSQATTTHILALIRETFGLDSDQTSVDRARRQVILHRPDGVPDIVQQVAHGVENLLGGYRVSGHSFCGIIEGTLTQYTHLGDAATMTDNRIYDPALREDELDGERAGRRDDRWAFTNRDTSLEYKVAATLAAASRVLKGYEDELAEESLRTAVRVWEYEQGHQPVVRRSAYVPGHPETQQALAAVELLLATGENRFTRRLHELLPTIEEHISELGWAAARVLDYLEAGFEDRLRLAFQGYAKTLQEDLASNPFGVPFHPHVWGETWKIQWHAVRLYYLSRYDPSLFDRELVLRALNYVLGCHPASSTSLVSGVGAQSLTIAYGTNRAEFSYIPGGGASGPNLVRPDLPELKEDFPFLWQQAEYVIGGAATYIFCTLAADRLLNG
jgi:endoglucanase